MLASWFDVDPLLLDGLEQCTSCHSFLPPAAFYLATVKVEVVDEEAGAGWPERRPLRECKRCLLDRNAASRQRRMGTADRSCSSCGKQDLKLVERIEDQSGVAHPVCRGCKVALHRIQDEGPDGLEAARAEVAMFGEHVVAYETIRADLGDDATSRMIKRLAGPGGAGRCPTPSHETCLERKHRYESVVAFVENVILGAPPGTP